jgi:hypothetical protein
VFTTAAPAAACETYLNPSEVKAAASCLKLIVGNSAIKDGATDAATFSF